MYISVKHQKERSVKCKRSTIYSNQDLLQVHILRLSERVKLIFEMRETLFKIIHEDRKNEWI